jgi:hypothetical protein
MRKPNDALDRGGIQTALWGEWMIARGRISVGATIAAAA